MRVFNLKNAMLALSLSVLLAWLLMAFAAFFVGGTANQIDLDKLLKTADAQSWLGYDELGRALFDRLMLGAQTSLFVAVGVVVFASIIGTSLGIYSGFVGGWVDKILLKIFDVFLAFPGLLLAIALAAVLGPGIENVIFALAAVGWVGFARLARAQTLSIKNREHIQAAKALGVSQTRILIRHVLPLILAVLGIEATFGFAGAVLSEAGLSFLGLGVQPPAASLGNMIREGTRYLLVAPHLVIIPGILLMLMVLAINILGDRWRDYLDVKTRNLK